MLLVALSKEYNITKIYIYIYIYEIIPVLKSIHDPELSVDIYELGIIYDIRISNNFFIKIIMTLTTLNCPVAEILPLKVKHKIFNIKNVKNVEIILTFYPNWTYDMISEVARLE